MALSKNASCDGMRSLLDSFMNAKTPDDQSSAFQVLRCFVSRNGSSCLSEGITGATMSRFLEILHEFGGTKRRLANQIAEVIKYLDTKGGEDWQMHIDLQRKQGKLSFASSSNSGPTTSTFVSSDVPEEHLRRIDPVPPSALALPEDLQEGDTVEITFGKSGLIANLVEQQPDGRGVWLLKMDDGRMCEVPEEHLRRIDPVPPSALALPEDLQEGDTVEITFGNSGLIANLVEQQPDGRGVWLLKMDDGRMCEVPEEHLRRIHTDSSSSVLEVFHFQPDHAADSVHKLHAALLELLSLLSETQTNDQREANLKQISSDYRKEWTRILEDKDLHYVIAGLVSSGKTTLTNGLLAHSMPGQWTGNMLQSAALENTAAVTMFAYNAERAKKDGKIHARIEAVRMTRSHDGEAPRYQSHDDESSSTVNCMKELKDEMPLLSDKLAGTHDGFKRLIVEIPSPLSVIPGMTPTAPNMLSSEVLVDTPGLDSFGLKEHLVSILAQKCFLYCFVVDVQSPSPFGNHGFEVLQHLAKNVEMMFPPVIIFTKLKLLEEESSLRTWKKANPGGLRQRLKDLVNRTLDKLEEAGVRHCPFFADVDALWASMDCKDCPEDKEQIQAAQEGLSEFFQDLVCLGRNIAVPLHQCRMLQLQNMTTQQIINEMHKEDGRRLLEGEHLDDLKAFGEKLKDDFSEKVDRYFDVKWTDHGIASYEPQPPFTRDTCAISRIPAEFKIVFHKYKVTNPKVGDKLQAVTQIVEETYKLAVQLILTDLSTYDTDALSSLKVSLWQKVGKIDPDLKKHLSSAFWTYLFGGGLRGSAYVLQMAGSVASWIAMGAGASAVAMAVAGGVCALAVAACAAWMYLVGSRTWEEAENASWKAVLEFCDKNSLRISKHAKSCFNQKVDDILKKIVDHRISECKAAKIQSAARQGYEDVAEQVRPILGDKKEKWLGKKTSVLEQICNEVLEERQQTQERKAEQVTDADSSYP